MTDREKLLNRLVGLCKSLTDEQKEYLIVYALELKGNRAAGDYDKVYQNRKRRN